MFEYEHGVIPACDVDSLDKLKRLVDDTNDVEGIVAYKIGKTLGSKYSVPKIVSATKDCTDKPIIYDAQKEGNDVKFTAKSFVDMYAESGIESLILFPFAGPENIIAFVGHLRVNNIEPIAGFELTQPIFYSTDSGNIDDVLDGIGLPESVEEEYGNIFEDYEFRGFIEPEAKYEARRIYTKLGVDKHIAPGNKPDAVRKKRKEFEGYGIEPIFLMPGIGRQKGTIPGAFDAAGAGEGKSAYVIIGSGIRKAQGPDGKARSIKEAAQQFCDQALEYEK